MKSGSTNPRLLPALLLCGLMVGACCLGGSRSAAAFGMGFGRMGFGPAAGYGRGGPDWRRWRRPIGPGRGGIRLVDRPGWGGGHPRYEGWPRHPRVIGGGTVGGDIRRGDAGNNGRGAAPLRDERRYVPGEVITEFSAGASPQEINRIARRYDLTQLESQRFALIGSTLFLWRVGGRRTIPDVLDALRRERIVASAQPNYVYSLQQQVSGAAGTSGEAAQYVLGKLQVAEAHHFTMGKGITVAVLDSEIDTKQPDLAGAIVKSYDALGGKETPHEHGTAMAGAIAAHGKLLGIAPDAKLLAARVFDDTPGEAKGTSVNIYKGLQWAADNGARVVNMSFTGPADPDLHRMVTAAYEKGIVLVAAAGNAGPNAAPPYPAADPDVIAVTATDDNDGLFKMDNRGRYIAVAAPGVEILALAPDESVQITTGTSVAAAHVSGIAALLLELKPSLKPKEIRAILTTTAKRLTLSGPATDFGSGLANAYRAVTSLDGKSALKDSGPTR